MSGCGAGCGCGGEKSTRQGVAAGSTAIEAVRARDILQVPPSKDNLTDDETFWVETSAFHLLEDKAESALRPLRAILELTFQCNFECVHCYNPRPEGGYHAEEWNTAQIKRVLDRLAGWGVLFLTISGGESMVRRDYFEVLDYARKKRFALRLFTNGSLIDEEGADQIAAAAPLSVDISIYGASEESYYAVTKRHGMFQRTLDGIRRLRERGLHLILKTPVLKENELDLGAIAELARSLNEGDGQGSRPSLPSVLHMFDGKIIPRDGNDLTPYEHMVDLHGRSWDEWALLRQAGCGGTAPGTKREAGEHVCDVGKRGITITPQGDVFPCIRFRKSAGNIFEEDMEHIWKHSVLTTALRELRIGQMEECFSCKYQPWCRPCPADAFYETGRYTAPPRNACRYMEALYDAGMLHGLEAEPDGSKPVPNGLREYYAAKERLQPA